MKRSHQLIAALFAGLCMSGLAAAAPSTFNPVCQIFTFQDNTPLALGVGSFDQLPSSLYSGGRNKYSNILCKTPSFPGAEVTLVVLSNHAEAGHFPKATVAGFQINGDLSTPIQTYLLNFDDGKKANVSVTGNVQDGYLLTFTN